MRRPALAFMITSALLFAACSSLPFVGGGKTVTRAPAPPNEADLPAAPPPSAEPAAAASPDAAEKLDAPLEPAKKGFFSKLAKRLGSDSSTPNVGACPAVRVLYDNQRFVELTGPERFENVGYTGEIVNVSSSCRFVGSDPITINMQVDMAFGKGPRAQGASKDVVYWVAVTRKDIATITRERFTQRVVIPAGTDRVQVTTPVTTLTIPRANKDIAGVNFEVLVGFELTPDQLEFNRNGKRFRVDAGVPR